MKNLLLAFISIFLSVLMIQEAFAAKALCARVENTEWIKSSFDLDKGILNCYYSDGSLLSSKTPLKCAPYSYLIPNNWTNGTCIKSAKDCQIIYHPENQKC